MKKKGGGGGGVVETSPFRELLSFKNQSNLNLLYLWNSSQFTFFLIRNKVIYWYELLSTKAGEEIPKFTISYIS